MPPPKHGQPYKRVGKDGRTSYGPRKPQTVASTSLRTTEASSATEKFESIKLANSIDERMGFVKFDSGRRKVGWLINMRSTTVEDDNVLGGRAGVDFYFLGDNGDYFKATVEYDPYFLVAIKRGREPEVEEWIRRGFEGLVKNVKRVEKEDLSMPNHLLGYRRTLLQLSFANVSDLLAVRKVIMPIAEKNKKNVNAMDTYAEVASSNAGFDIFDDDNDVYERRHDAIKDASDSIVDIREYDVPYHVRVAIDKDIRIGRWYNVDAKHGQVSLSCIEDRLQRADPVVMAFDIETTKLPLKFPDASIDQIMMISYMIDGQGFLITNREIVSEDIADFDYTPKPEYDGPFIIFNEDDEQALLERFFEHIKEARPTVIVTYNGDFFDWPFVEARASVLGIDMYHEIGFRKNSEDVYQSDYCAHMDAFAWVNRDSYLPQGSRGLKAVTVAKLGYDPDELDPELMTPYASERPQTLAEYSVSDAVATYYLYMKYVHPFIFSLCTIIPLGPDDVLRKGTGTLCEMLLMVQAYQKNILLPNKHQAPKEAFWEGHLLESETYVGGHVESIEAGVFRADIPCAFSVDTKAIDELLRDLDAALKFCITVEEKKSLDDVENYDEVYEQIAAKLSAIKAHPNKSENPLIYHLDVASMYPNIMTTNRLQPDSMINESDCAACDFNRPGKTCDRRLPWAWRGEFLPAKRDEYNMIRNVLENERFPGKFANSLTRAFSDFSIDEQAAMVKKRLQDYSKKIYHKIHDARTIEREAIICQRENPFYVDTVKDFRDRRYDFKGKQKVWKGKTDALKAAGAPAAEVEEAKKMIVLFDSLQLAHKVILNSFYGYVMRKGSRWYSMEMAGVTCLTGARIIQMARQLVERIGRPLELDTDGIWCILPASFPENFTFKLKNGKKMSISYPCVMLNHLVHASFTNHQYQELTDPSTFKYKTYSDNTIFFEVDGPYKAMVLPTSKEEDKNLKKRYAVFNHDGTLAELKGFEVKRRGELKLIKIFQTQIFKFFLEGSTLAECYTAVARVANRWLDVLHGHGSTLADQELIDLICENKSMAKTLEEYGAQKSTAITTAKRLAEFLGEQMIKDKGLNCKYIISSRPRNMPVTERAIPVAIFSAEENTKRFFLRKWLKEDPGTMDPRNVIDWDYYLERLGSQIQKLITIPAALQKVGNPVPRVAHPDWLDRRVKAKEDRFQQKKMTDMFESQEKPLKSIDPNVVANRILGGELEDYGSSPLIKVKKAAAVTKMMQQPKRKTQEIAVTPAVDPFAALPSKMPSIDDDYPGWLKYQKQKWKIQKQARLRRRQLFGERTGTTTDALGTFFRNQSEMLLTSAWQLIQLRQSEMPGEIKAFVLLDKKIHELKVVIPRQLYLNLHRDDLPDIEIKGCQVEKLTNYTLPNGHPSVHLFKLTMSEDVYRKEQRKVSQLLAHASVEGVYETQIPLSTRAVLELGSMCSVDATQKGVLGKGLEQGFTLDSLRKFDGQEPYLADSRLQFLYIYHGAWADKQIFAIFSTTSKQACVIMQTATRETQPFPSFERLYRDIFAKRCEEQPAWQNGMDYSGEQQIRFVQVTTRKRALDELNVEIKRMRNEAKNEAVALAIQSPQTLMLMHDLPIIKELPILSLKADDIDKQLPSLGWQAVLARRVVSHYLDLGAWVAQYVALARYGNVPLCNLESHDPRYIIDIAFARRLQKERVLLWWSNGPKPDHAGYEQDDVVRPLEEVEMPTVNNPGAYHSVCIDLSVRNLAINTILASALINEAEGSDSVSFNPAAPADGAGTDGTNVIYSESAFASAGILVLREMVKAWWSEACSSQDSMADVMVQHLVRWVESPASHLYDRSLHHYVQVMSRKALQQLMNDFKRVGSHIVYASPHRLLLQTTKTEVGNAYAYSQYILKNVKNKPIFTFVELEIQEYWDHLIWYDAFNYGGKGCVTVTDAESQALDTIMNWQLATFLPQPMQPVFNDWIVEFIDLIRERKRPQTVDGGEHGTDMPPRLTQLAFKSLTEETGPVVDMNDPLHGLPKDFTKPLTKQITTLIRRQQAELLHPDLASDYIFPDLPGSHLNLENPALQLVKSIMHVIGLDRSMNLVARQLRAQLLALFDIKEFSAQATFLNPSTSCMIENLICDECCSIRDLDLCRNSDVLPAQTTTSSTQDEMEDSINPAENNNSSTNLPPWRCQTCQTSYDRLRIEERLITRVQRMLTAWSTQDLKCNKCSRLRNNEFMEHCACAGEWVATVSRDAVRKELDILGRVAKFFGLGLLEGCVGEVRDEFS